MRLLAPITALLLLSGMSTGLFALQRGGYGQDEYGGAREAFSSSDFDTGKNEYSWSRLRYTGPAEVMGVTGTAAGRVGRGDYPKADRQFLIALRRLTRINARSVEQVVDLDSEGPESIENFPWVYAVQVQTWTFTEPEAKRMRAYLLKGGFLMVERFSWRFRLGTLHERHADVFPDRPIEDLTDKDEFSRPL